MLTPVFECSQENGFVIVRLFLSAICKVMDAVFDIIDNQFTFYCSPYYLRLRFDQCLQEDKGERATYDLESNVLTVYLPKANANETFTKLDNPAYLIATEKQRAELIRVLDDGDGGSVGERGANGEPEEMEETEFVQTLAEGTVSTDAALTNGHAGSNTTKLNVFTEEGKAECSYGFANAFSGLFSKLDPDIVREVVGFRANPEQTSRQERHEMRIVAETSDFDEEALLLAYEDTDGEIAEVLKYVPAHISDFRRALQGSSTAAASGVVYASIPTASVPRLPRRPDDALEEEETTLLGGDRPVMVWQGNIADFKKPLIEEIEAATPSAAITATVENEVGHSVSSAVPDHSAAGAAVAATASPSSLPRTRLAIPKVRPPLRFTTEENEVLQCVKMPRLFFPPAASEVEALTADLLFSEAYDDLVTEGAGCSESLWNLVQLSPALSFLDPADTLYDACVGFARRALIYPIHRHCALLQRVWAVVGTRLLLGKAYTIRALLRVRNVLSHAEHKHILSTIYLDPLIAYWMHTTDAEERLSRMALELHQHVSRTKPITVPMPHRAGVSTVHTMLDAEKKTLNPLTLLYFGLPLAEEEEEAIMENEQGGELQN